MLTTRGTDDHLCNFTGACSPAYHYLPPRARSAIEQRILRAAEFTSAVVVPFVLDDFKQFFVGPPLPLHKKSTGKNTELTTDSHATSKAVSGILKTKD